VQFGIISTANIGDLAVVPAIRDSEHEVRAVASRDADRAAAFADRHDIPERYDSYDALLGADIDAVYNPSRTRSTPSGPAGRPTPASTSSARNRSPPTPRRPSKSSSTAATPASR